MTEAIQLPSIKIIAHVEQSTNAHINHVQSDG